MHLWARRERWPALLAALSLTLCTLPVTAADELAETVERLWIQASDGAIRHRDLVQPSKDSLIAMGPAAVPQLLPRLHTEDAREKHTITDIFKGIGEPAVPDLVAVLGTGDQFHTVHTLMALGKIGAAQATPAMVPFLRDERAPVRSEAAEAIGKCGGPGAGEALLLALHDPHEDVRKSGAVGLGRLGVREAVPSLVDALDDRRYAVRYAAATALVGLDSGYKAVDLLPDIQGRARALILHALAKHGSAKRREVAWSYIDDGPAPVRAEAARVIASLRLDARRRDAVEQHLRKERHPLVRYHLRRALERASP